ncbi:MAG: nitrilase-related carbon-nitrogen hydrolase, partial [Thiothrix litoralis]
MQDNLRKVREAIHQACEQQADVVVFPELVLAGYPPEDLLFRPDFIAQMQAGVDALAAETHGITVILGAPVQRAGLLQNMACVLRDGQVLAEYAKQCLPNYRVFDEKRYFTPGTEPLVIEVAGVKLGLLNCEDIWEDAPAKAAVIA